MKIAAFLFLLFSFTIAACTTVQGSRPLEPEAALLVGVKTLFEAFPPIVTWNEATSTWKSQFHGDCDPHHWSDRGFSRKVSPGPVRGIRDTYYVGLKSGKYLNIRLDFSPGSGSRRIHRSIPERITRL